MASTPPAAVAPGTEPAGAASGRLPASAPRGPAATAIPYSFARANGVLMVPGSDRLAIRRGAKPGAILEARRVAGRGLLIDSLSDEAFDRLRRMLLRPQTLQPLPATRLTFSTTMTQHRSSA
jgi:hypothetical protein